MSASALKVKQDPNTFRHKSFKRMYLLGQNAGCEFSG